MLTLLTIKNFALIESLERKFYNGFSIITGETGAGKSILLGALGLLQGKRADLGSLKNKEEKCVVEGHFNIKEYKLKEVFATLDIEYEEVTIIRREILPSGKSRAFVNDSPVNLADLQELSSYLIDIHSQHQTGELSDENYQLHIIDAVADNNSVLEEYQAHLKQYKKLQSKLKEFLQTQAELLKEQDYNAFLLQELEEAHLSDLNQEQLEAEFDKLNNVEFVRENFSHALTVFTDEQVGLVAGLREARNILSKLASISKEYEELSNRISSVDIEVEDIVGEIENMVDSVISDPEQLAITNEKLQLLYSLQKKHQVATVEELITIENELSGKVFLATDLEDKIVEVTKEIESLENVLERLAKQLSEARKKAVPVLQKQLIDILKQVGMPNSNFKFEFEYTAHFMSNGKDQMQLLFSANKGMDFGLLKKVASGGEMSRIMLAIKSTLAKYSNLPTIIFDEIDTGVSGEVADKMGEIMREMSKEMQVFAITHLPQIAAKGDTHFKVFKTAKGETTTSQIEELTYESRITEVAQMLSGKDISESALVHAKELLQR
ncbi:DNA repair protein RecN [Myroides albus]|uniref:DNA repair protein RecN n=1 Tax=Myroides albus TaxID=2562892 RepID=A0A6I3LFV5_9FLAO|nr:DNA repair protein RecN [Myroides albus]MTG98369.1 DNA repair protein RecN [Myroides albus]UVD80362.1 DNA repair protein RecN [Myroides albus]